MPAKRKKVRARRRNREVVMQRNADRRRKNMGEAAYERWFDQKRAQRYRWILRY